ncbi:MAG TPA: plasma-membrane proton-efflux P-type ATPase [Candidatus Acidoferrales bacterium]|nr:plasma-membrane proton-efflux P-type ATPase [Candidatus Acidoferrales bacterium]
MVEIPITTEKAKKADVEELLQKLSSSEKGLSTSQAQERLQKFGPNEISERKLNPVVKFLTYFWGPIPWMIEIAIILSAIIGRYEDFGVILALLFLNGTVGFWQERKAENAIELLKRRLAPKAKTLRDGKWSELLSRDLVPGDIVRVRLGDVVPADVKLIEGEYLLTDESALTGESLPVERHIYEVAYSGSIVRQGEMNALVVTTGMNTYFGKTAKLVEEATTRSHFQKAVIKIGDYLIVLAVALAAVILITAFIRHDNLLIILQFALVLTVAAIPVALPAVLSVTMAVGAIALARKEAIVSRLVAIEEMAGMDVLCADKTGTITKNELTVAEVHPFEGFKDNDIIILGTQASREEDQDLIDNAVIAKAKEMNVLDGAYKGIKVLEFKPFDPKIKRTEATIETADGTRFKVSKGAPQVILEIVARKEDIRTKMEKVVNEFASKGYRALGVAKTDAQGKWQYAGLIPLYDPPRDDSAETIETAVNMGVDVKMVTGDHTAIAKEIAKRVHLGTNILPASSFMDKPDKEVENIVETADGFAEVFPEHKFHIVELLQKKEHIVGMTGDGVNDAPALKKSDAGIAVTGATDAAKSAAAIVLTNPGLSVIIDSIKESRKIFQRMNSYSIYRIGETIRVLLFITLSILVFNFYPVTAIMIVLLALLNDGAILSIAYDRARFSSTPEVWNMRALLSVAVLFGTVGVVGSFSLFYLADAVFHIARVTIQSMMYLKLSVAGHFMIFAARTRDHFWSRPHPAHTLLGAVIGTQLVATLIVVSGVLMAPISWTLALVVWGYAMGFFLITDSLKVPLYKFLDRVSTTIQSGEAVRSYLEG